MFRKYGRWLKLTIKPAKLKSKSSGSAVVEINHCLYFLGGIANMQMWNFRYITNFKKRCLKKVGLVDCSTWLKNTPNYWFFSYPFSALEMMHGSVYHQNKMKEFGLWFAQVFWFFSIIFLKKKILIYVCKILISRIFFFFQMKVEEVFIYLEVILTDTR